MLEELLERRSLVVVGEAGSRREELVRELVSQALSAGLSPTVLDYYGFFKDLQLRTQAPVLPYSAISEHLPLALRSMPGPLTSSAEAAAADAIARSRTLSECLARLASRADPGANLAFRKLSLLSGYIVDRAPPPDARCARVELASAPILCRKALTLLWIAYLSCARALLPEVVVVGELNLSSRERAWVEHLLEELAARGVKLVLLDRSMQRWHLRHAIVIAEMTPETRARALALKLPVPSEGTSDRKILLVDGGPQAREIDFRRK